MARPLLLVVALLTGCAGAPRPGAAPPARVVLEIRATRMAPTAALSAGDDRVEARPATYCWSQRCVDATGFPAPERSLTVPEGTELSLEGDATAVDVTVTEPPDRTGGEALQPGDTVLEIGLGSGPAVIGVPPGDYWLVVFSRWEAEPPTVVVGGPGDATFAFAVEVV